MGLIANRSRERGPGTRKKQRLGGGYWDMGLLTILKKMKQKERELRLLMLGLDNAGKTTILKKFNGEDIDTISPTLGFNIKTLEHRGYKLDKILDVQKSCKDKLRSHSRSSDLALLWLWDPRPKQVLSRSIRAPQVIRVEQRLAGATLLIFANKQDLPGALSSKAIREALELDSIRSHHWCIQGCSAVTGENLLPGIDWLLDDISSRIFMAD
uniref:ADP-ribosylation factor-like protein 2 n=1 Tax=Sus scrofa TaxID=9823 RepID=A0A8D0PYE0_PIG